MRDAFYNLYKQDKGAALRALNDDRLSFPPLYALRPEITKLGLESQLSGRNYLALELSKELASNMHYTQYESIPEDKSVLIWMFKTGCAETDFGDEYDNIMDLTAALLIKVHNDKSCLRELCGMIFSRHRSGLFTYDAEWAFFECGDPECIAITAEYLLSKDHRDVILARRLLHFLPCIDDTDPDAAAQHRRVMQWIKQNKPYLYYTGENGLLCGDPCRFRVSLESKYLQKPLYAGSGGNSLSPRERQKAMVFSALDEQTKSMLGECSGKLHKESPQKWASWINAPMKTQIESVERIVGRGQRNGKG